MSGNVEGNASPYIVFDQEKYDYGNNYNTATGVYSVPYDGLYLIHVRVYGLDNRAHHQIMVNGAAVTYVPLYDPDFVEQAISTSIVLHLMAKDQLAVNPWFSETIHGNPTQMVSSFGANLLYVDHAD